LFSKAARVDADTGRFRASDWIRARTWRLQGAKSPVCLSIRLVPVPVPRDCLAHEGRELDGWVVLCG